MQRWEVGVTDPAESASFKKLLAVSGLWWWNKQNQVTSHSSCIYLQVGSMPTYFRDRKFENLVQNVRHDSDFFRYCTVVIVTFNFNNGFS